MHHAGLLPIVKEVVEMLFCRGVIKVMLSTHWNASCLAFWGLGDGLMRLINSAIRISLGKIVLSNYSPAETGS